MSDGSNRPLRGTRGVVRGSMTNAGDKFKNFLDELWQFDCKIIDDMWVKTRETLNDLHTFSGFSAWGLSPNYLDFFGSV